MHDTCRCTHSPQSSRSGASRRRRRGRGCGVRLGITHPSRATRSRSARGEMSKRKGGTETSERRGLATPTRTASALDQLAAALCNDSGGPRKHGGNDAHHSGAAMRTGGARHSPRPRDCEFFCSDFYASRLEGNQSPCSPLCYQCRQHCVGLRPASRTIGATAGRPV